MPLSKKTIKWVAIAALIIIPVIFVMLVARAHWVHNPLNYYSQQYTGPDKTKAAHQVSNIVLTDHYGQKVSMGLYDSSVLVVNIFFATCPEICPKMNSQIEAVAGEFRKLNKVQFLSVSIDPEHDSVPVLANYARKFNANGLNWKFSTGSKSEIYDWVLNDLLLASEQRGKEFIHDDKVVIIDRDRYVRSILPSGGKTKREDFEAFKHIKDDIENLLYEYRQKDMAE